MNQTYKIMNIIKKGIGAETWGVGWHIEKGRWVDFYFHDCSEIDFDCCFGDDNNDIITEYNVGTNYHKITIKLSNDDWLHICDENWADEDWTEMTIWSIKNAISKK